MMSGRVTIDDLRKLARDRDQQAIIAICVERDGTLTTVTYGETRLKCRAAGWWCDGFIRYAQSLSRIPFATVFGWGNGGEPVALTPAEVAQVPASVPRELYHVEAKQPQ